MKYETVLFDLDGTLLYTLEDLKDAVNHELARCGDPQRTLEEVRSFVGNGLRMLMRRALPAACSEEEVTERTASMRAYYYENSCNKTTVYPGVLELMEKLKAAGVAVGVVSNKVDESVQVLCQRFFPGLVDAATGEVQGLPRKPEPATIELTLERMGREKAGAVYVGDSTVDLEAAKNAGLPCIAVCWGFQDREVLEAAGAQVIAATAEELWAALQ